MENKKIILQLIISFILAIIFVPIVVDAGGDVSCVGACQQAGYNDGFGCYVSGFTCSVANLGLDSACVTTVTSIAAPCPSSHPVCCCVNYKSSGSSCTSAKSCQTTVSGNFSCYYTQCNGLGYCSSGWKCDWCCVGNKSLSCSGGVCATTGATCVKGYCNATCAADSDCSSGYRCNTTTCTCELIGACAPCNNTVNTACSCPSDGCVGNDYYDYPAYGKCTTACACDTGTGSGQPCQPTISYNDSRCVTCSSYTTKSGCETGGCCWCTDGVTSWCQNCPCSGQPPPPAGTPIFTANGVNDNITVTPGTTVTFNVSLGCAEGWIQGAACANDFGIYDAQSQRWVISVCRPNCVSCCTDFSYCGIGVCSDVGTYRRTFSTIGTYSYFADVFTCSGTSCSSYSGNCAAGCYLPSACYTDGACGSHSGCPNHICASPSWITVTVANPPCQGQPDGSQPSGCSGNNYCCGGQCIIKPASCPECQYVGLCCSGTSAVCCNSSTSTTCGTKDCDYLDSTCRDYHDVTKYCNGSGSCADPSCASYTDASISVECGTKTIPCPGGGTASCTQYCDGNGSCSDCTPVCNQPPTATNLQAKAGCIWPLVRLYFTYNDNDGIDSDPMSEYEVQIDDNTNEGDGCLLKVTDMARLEKGATTTTSVNYSLPIGENIQVKTIYYWRVKVKDSQDTWSDWAEGTFDLHPM